MDIQSLAVGSLFGILAGLVVAWLTQQTSLHQVNAEFKYENADLQKRLLDSQEEVLALEKREAECITKEEHDRDHGRDQQQVAILKLLDPHEGKRLCDISQQFALSEKATTFHLQSLSADGFVASPDYRNNPELGKPFYKPSNSTWLIQQPGLAYLAKNNELP